MKLKLSLAAVVASFSLSSFAASTVYYTHIQCNGDVDFYQNGYDFYFSSHNKTSCIGEDSATSDASNCKRNMLNFAPPFVRDANDPDNLPNILRYQFKGTFDAHPYDEFNIVWQMLPGMTPSGQFPVFALNTQKDVDGKYKLQMTTRSYSPYANIPDENEQDVDVLIDDLEVGTGKEYNIVLVIYPTHSEQITRNVGSESKSGTVTYGYLLTQVDGVNNYTSNVLLHSDIDGIVVAADQKDKMNMSIGQYWKDTVSNDDLTKKYKNGFKNTAIATQDSAGYRWHPTALATPRVCNNLGS